MKMFLSIFLLTYSCNLMADWIGYSNEANGDLFFFDNSRVKKSGEQVNVWTRVKYKTSVMGASSYQSLLKLDCQENTETVLQSTFYSDAEWKKPAMATNTNAKPKNLVKPNSATERLVKILCKE